MAPFFFMTDTTRSSQYSVGDTVSLDEIECLIVYAAETEQSWGRYLCVDKNHDLIWYIEGDDCVNEDTNASDGTDCINPDYKYGYEWGGHGTTTGITDTAVGAGLTNTNSLIGMNLQPNTSGWPVIWDKVAEARTKIGSNKWFVPSKDELDLIYTNRASLTNLSLATEPYYWSSTESDSNNAWYQLNTGAQLDFYKYRKYIRVRLCRYATDADLNPSQTTPIEITCETEGADIRYTLDGSDPTEESTLYSGQFEVTPPVTIKARGYKEGMLASDVASYEVEAPAVPVPMALPDGSVLFYDRGEEYGEYHIGDDGYPVRDDGAVDNGSAESTYWRYLICDSTNLSERRQWGPSGTNEGMTDTKYEDFGYGLPNTEALLSKYGGNSSYIWQLVQNKRNATGGKKWFVPSKDELNIVYQNKDTIVNTGGGSFPTNYVYWSSSEGSSNYAWFQNFSNGTQISSYKVFPYYCRLLRRI